MPTTPFKYVDLQLERLLVFFSGKKIDEASKTGCCGAAAVLRRTRDRKVAGSTPGRGVIH